MRIVESIRIERPPEDVWAVVTDLDSHLEWRPSLEEFRQVSDGPLGVGTRIREVLSWRGRRIELDDVVTAFDPPHRLGIRGGWKAADFELDLVLEPVGEGATTVTFDWPFHPKTLFLKIAAPLMRWAMRSSTREEAELLKQYVERRSPTPG